MTKACAARHQDVETIVIQKLQEHLGTSDDLPLTSRLYADLGLDSITFAATLLDITSQLQLDLGTARINLNTVQTLEELISLVRSLRSIDTDKTPSDT
jgi:acyl carrier protein